MTEKLKPVLFIWDGNVMIPHNRFKELCDKQYAVGERYFFAPVDDRSIASHNHYFAVLHDVWINLPENEQRFLTPDDLRKYLLIKAGYAHERIIACADIKSAQEVEALAAEKDFAVVSRVGAVVKIWTAKSQSRKAMGAAEFQESKQKVLELAAEMLGVSVDELTQTEEQP